MAKEIAEDFRPVCVVYKDGTVERFDEAHEVPAGDDAKTKVSSRDVTIILSEGELEVAARLYLPRTKKMSRRKLPIVVYVHGGLYVGGSPFSSIYHPYQNKLASKSKVIVVGVKFRVPPEVPFTASLEDVWTTLKWLASDNSDGWVSKYGDLEKVTLMGDCTGCILINEAARRAATEPLPNGVAINGLVLVHPTFWGERPLPGEEDYFEGLSLLGSGLWKLAQPNCGNGSDDPMLNPTGPLAPPLTDLACKRVLVCSAEKDWLKFRAWDYYNKLGLSGWEGDAEYWETDAEDHVFHLYEPSNEDAKILLKRVAAFIKGRHASSMTSRVTPLF